MTSIKKECPYCHLAIDISLYDPQSVCPFCGENLSYTAEELKYFQVAKSSVLMGEIVEPASNNNIFDLSTFRSKNNGKNYSRMILWVLSLIIVGLCVYFIPKLAQNSVIRDTSYENSSANNSNSQKVVQIPAPATSDKYIGRNYEEVIMDFRNAGFTKVEPYPLYDINVFWFGGNNGKVESISIKGDPDYDTSTLYPSNTSVKIKYHCWAKDKK